MPLRSWWCILKTHPTIDHPVHTIRRNFIKFFFKYRTICWLFFLLVIEIDTTTCSFYYFSSDFACPGIKTNLYSMETYKYTTNLEKTNPTVWVEVGLVFFPSFPMVYVNCWGLVSQRLLQLMVVVVLHSSLLIVIRFGRAITGTKVGIDSVGCALLSRECLASPVFIFCLFLSRAQLRNCKHLSTLVKRDSNG